MPVQEFQQCVARYGGDYKSREFSCRISFVNEFAQLTSRVSARHRSLPAFITSDSADALREPLWRTPMRPTIGESLIHIARPMYASNPLGVDIDATVYALDSTTIDLCLSVFSWRIFAIKRLR